MSEFHKLLNLWYQQNKRSLPWRLNNDPYSVWVSEIILQQTTVKQGRDYYLRFIDRFPDVNSLANATENEVLKLWQGLGYYSRARNMHFTSKLIVNKYQSRFPDSYDEIRKLKGIGDYTAAAIASISFGIDKAVLDGNVCRVLSRIFGIDIPIDTSKGKKELSTLAWSLLDKKNPGQFNESLMDFGALQCIPRNPTCSICPFKNKCVAFNHKKVDLLPVRSKETKQKKRYFNYFYITFGRYFFLEQRKTKDIWRNLFQFPLIETEVRADLKTLTEIREFTDLFKGQNNNMKIESVSPEIIHPLTHQKLFIRFFDIHLQELPANTHWIMTDKKELSKYPLPKPVENYLSYKFPHEKIL